MKKQDYSQELGAIKDNTKYIPVEVNDEMKKSFISYAMAVNVSRAIPDVRDGLKPVHRRIIYTMGEMGVYSDKPFRKCARIVGEVMGKYHPHGDSSIYDALVRLAQDFSINTPLVDGHGNFGSVDGDPAAAQRYTEARLAKISNEMLRDINKETVDFYPNYDETEMQPRVLPSRFPNLLVNGSDGIAVGMATNIPPHNLGEVIDGVVALIENPDVDIEDLIKIIPAPDYPTRGLIMNSAAVRYAYRTGRGGIVVRARTEIEEMPNGRSRIIVTELPYQVNKAKLIITIADLVKDKKIEGIADIKDESDREGMRMIIDIKKDYSAQVILNFLFKHTQLQVGDGIIFLALVDNVPKILNLKEILYYYLEHQKTIIVRRTKYDLVKAQEREHILEGLKIALNNIDEVIKTIKASKDKTEAILNLTAKFNLTDIQANAILEMKLQKLTGLEVDKINEELEGLLKDIARYNEILAKPELVLEIIKNELLEIKAKYAVPRKTEISYDYSDIDIGDLIEKEDVVFSLTHQGYIKRMPISEYRSQRRGGRGVSAHKTKEEDFVENLFTSSTHDDLFCFTTLGKVYSIKGYEVPEASKQAKGRAIINLLQLSDGEKVNAIIPVGDKTQGNLMMATRKGLIKKTSLSEFESIRKNGKIAIKLLEGDQLIGVQLTNGNNEVIVASNEGKCIRFNEKNVRQMGRETQGVKSMALSDTDYLVDMVVLKEDTKILTITSKGYGKRSNQEDYRLQGRAGKGIKAGKFNEKTGNLVALKQINEDNDIMVISSNGTIIRFKAQEVNIIGRDTKGVRIMRMQGNEEIVSVAIVEGETDDNLGEETLEEIIQQDEQIKSLENTETEEE